MKRLPYPSIQLGLLALLLGVTSAANAGDASILISVVGMPTNTDTTAVEATEQCASQLTRALRAPALNVDTASLVTESRLRAQLRNPPSENFMQWPATALERSIYAGSDARTYALVSCQPNVVDIAVFAPSEAPERAVVGHFRLRAPASSAALHALAQAVASYAEANTPI